MLDCDLGSKEVKAMGQIEDRLTGQTRICSSLAGFVDDLGGRLSPILYQTIESPEELSKNDDNAKVPIEPQDVLLAQSIADNTKTLIEITDRVKSILDRIAL